MAIDATKRAQYIYANIQRKSTQIVMTKPKVITKAGTTPATALAAQTVRVNTDSRATVTTGDAGIAPKRGVMIFGVVGHPDPSVEDNDLAEGYTFVFEGASYRINEVYSVPGGLQAIATTTGA